MIGISALPKSLKLNRSQAIWLEPEQFEQARFSQSVNPSLNEAAQWQLYLNAIALLGFEQWLQQRASEHVIDRRQCANEIGAVYNLKIDKFKLNLIVKEHILDEVAEIPKEALENSALAAHFYVLLEVSEEQQQVMIRGFLRSDRLVNYCRQCHNCLQDSYYKIPLSAFDLEPNHLLFYCDFSSPAAIPLRVVETQPSAAPEATLTTSSQETPIIQLGHWLQDIFTDGWQAVGDLFTPEVNLAWSPRNQIHGAKRGKLINLGVQLGQQVVALLVNVTSEAEGKVGVLVQLHPTGETQYLPPNLKLCLRSLAGQTLQEVTSRSQDNYIQLKSFKGGTGKRFKIAIALNDETVEENFEL